MNLQKGIWSSLCRRSIKPSNPPTISKSTRRFKWTYKSEEPLILPRVVIDLEAPDNPAVRDYDETKDNIPTRFQKQIIRSNDKAIARRTRLVRKQLEEGVEGFPRKRNRKNQRIRDDALEHELAYNPDAAPPPVTAMDLMNYALLGNPFSARASSERVKPRHIHMEKLFTAHGIDFKDTANMTIRTLTENFDISTDGNGVMTEIATENKEIAKKRNERKKKMMIERQMKEAQSGEQNGIQKEE
ncbi:hypothetical protein NHQ30_011251 [Ciborinia camelliae]|nr:hypothetical protein NHQ30_011251 [Ciborinia camelliae]